MFCFSYSWRVPNQMIYTNRKRYSISTTSRNSFPVMLNTTRLLLMILAFGKALFKSAGPAHLTFRTFKSQALRLSDADRYFPVWQMVYTVLS